jgi:hypothetical protein
MSDWVGSERRRTARFAVALTNGAVCARIRPGHDVRLIDVSAGGVFVQNVVRLLPGHSVDLLITSDERRAAIRGLVMRSVVSHVSRSAIWYRSAIAFEHLVPWLSDLRDIEYGLRARESASNGAARAPGSRF